jgi:hypothetical protein
MQTNFARCRKNANGFMQPAYFSIYHIGKRLHGTSWNRSCNQCAQYKMPSSIIVYLLRQPYLTLNNCSPMQPKDKPVHDKFYNKLPTGNIKNVDAESH